MFPKCNSKKSTLKGHSCGRLAWPTQTPKYNNTALAAVRTHIVQVLETNLKVLVKTEIVDDRREPVINFELNDGRTIEVLYHSISHFGNSQDEK